MPEPGSPPGFSVREAGVDRLDELITAYEWLFAPPGVRPAQWDPGRARRALGRAIGSDDSDVFVAIRDDRVIGFCTAYLDIDSVRFGRRCWVEDLAVDPAARSGGVGAALLAAARGWGTEQGATHLELDSGAARRDAHRFYEREGPDWRSNQYAWVLDR